MSTIPKGATLRGVFVSERNEVFVDLDYNEDSTAEVDMNVVATGEATLVEVQGTAEGKAFGRGEGAVVALDPRTGGVLAMVGGGA